jgi:Ser/Thr protein kinase RdoA (MazF antagonist)
MYLLSTVSYIQLQNTIVFQYFDLVREKKDNGDMDAFQIEKVCDAFELGKPVSTPQLVTGGFLHRVWRIKTTKSLFAIKELNREVISEYNAHQRFRQSEQIAAAFATKNLPVITALDGLEGPLLEIPGATVMVFPWVNGEVLPSTSVGTEQARLIGKLLASMHRIDLPFNNLKYQEVELFSAEEWASFVQYAEGRRLPCVDSLRDILPEILTWSQLAIQSNERLKRKLVVSHRDLDQKNVVWIDCHTPILLDWESAGLVNPTLEIIGAALSWSGQIVGSLRKDIFLELILGYREYNEITQSDVYDAMVGWISGRLSWLRYNIRRASASSASFSRVDRALRLEITLNTIKSIRSFSSDFEIWMGWID